MYFTCSFQAEITLLSFFVLNTVLIEMLNKKDQTSLPCLQACSRYMKQCHMIDDFIVVKEIFMEYGIFLVFLLVQDWY